MVRNIRHGGVKGPFMLYIVISRSTGEGLRPLDIEYGIPTEHGGCQMGFRQSDSFIVPKKSGNVDGGKGATQ